MTIRTKVTLLAVIPLTVALGMSATTSVFFLSQNAQSQAVHNAMGDLNQADTSISLFVENQFQLLHTLAIDEGLWAKTRQWSSYAGTKAATLLDLASGSAAEQAIGLRFGRILNSFDHITQIEAGTRTERYVMAPKGEKPAGYSPTQRPWYQAADANQKAALTKVRRTSEGNLVVSLSEPFSGQEPGIVSLSLSLKDLTRVTDSIQVGDHGFIMLFQDDGTIVTSGKTPELEGKTIHDQEASALAGLSLAAGTQPRLTWQGKVWDVLAQPSKVAGWVVVAFLDINEYEEQARTFLAILVGLTLVVLLIAMVLATWMAARISAPLKSVATGIRQIAEGDADLTVSLPVKGNDEVAALTTHFNAFLARLDGLVGALKAKATQLLESYASLSAALTENGASIHEITQSARLSAERLEKERGMVDQATERIILLSQGLERIQDGVEITRSSVQQASSSIEEMAGNIQATASMGERGGSTAVDLLAHAESGAEDMISLEESTRALYESSERISEVVTLITGIAGQTNLLAMNAAIEAAHAGDAGKGFAVVAEEIRKLAEQSSLGAQEIRNTVQEILGLVKANGEKTDRARQGFTEVRVRVSTVSELSAQIAAAMLEQAKANQELLESVSSMRQKSDAIGTLASEEAEGSRKIREFLAELTKLSQEISASKDEEAMGLEEINRATADITTVSADLKVVADDIQREFSRFVTTSS